MAAAPLRMLRCSRGDRVSAHLGCLAQKPTPGCLLRLNGGWLWASQLCPQPIMSSWSQPLQQAAGWLLGSRMRCSWLPGALRWLPSAPDP